MGSTRSSLGSRAGGAAVGCSTSHGALKQEAERIRFSRETGDDKLRNSLI